MIEIYQYQVIKVLHPCKKKEEVEEIDWIRRIEII